MVMIVTIVLSALLCFALLQLIELHFYPYDTAIAQNQQCSLIPYYSIFSLVIFDFFQSKNFKIFLVTVKCKGLLSVYFASRASRSSMYSSII